MEFVHRNFLMHFRTRYLVGTEYFKSKVSNHIKYGSQNMEQGQENKQCHGRAFI